MGTKRIREQGYTLVELMVVVGIIGILAAVATYGVKKYVDTAKTSEALEMINNIRSAQESFKDETFRYLNVSPMTSYFPFPSKAALKNRKMAWSAAGIEGQAWAQLGVAPTSVVQFGYACSAGQGNTAPSWNEVGTAQSIGLPAGATDWFVVRAVANRDEDEIYATFVGSSFTDQIYGENEAE